MAKALVELVGDSASAVRALEQTSSAVDATTASFNELSVAAAKSADAMVAASSQRIARFQAEAQAASQLAASYKAVGSETEAAAASALAARRNSQADRLLGVGPRPSALQTAGTVGRGLTTYVTAPAAFIGYEAVKQAINFNQQMLLLKTQAGDATDSIKQLSTAVLEMSKTAPQGPTQLAQGLFHLVSLGLRGSQALGTLHEASLAAGMGIANLEDTTTALGASVVSGIKGAQDYNQAMGTLVATAGSGNVRMEDLAGAIGSVLPAAAASGISLKEMGAAIAVMTDRGFAADEATTRLRMALALIQSPSEKAKKALADMGVNADSLGVQLRQPNGLLTVLQTLHDAVARVGAVRGNRDLLAGFGGGRSGLGIQTLVQSLDSSVSSYQGKLELIGEQQKQFAANQQQYLESPAYKLHAALSTVEADLVKMGDALAPAVVAMAGALSKIADGFSALPGPIKDSIGIAIGLLAVGGPLALAIKGIGTLLGGLRAAFALLGPSAAAGAASAETSLTGIGTSAAAAETEVAGLRASLLGLATLGAITIPILISEGIKLSSGSRFTPVPTGDGNTIDVTPNGLRGGLITRSGQRVGVGQSAPPIAPGSQDNHPHMGPHRSRPDLFPSPRTGGDHTDHTPHQGTIQQFVLPYQLQVEQAKAATTRGTADDMRSLRDIIAYTKRMIDSGRLSHAAYLQALQEEGSAESQLWADQTKNAKAAAAAAKADKKKADTFALPLRLQVEMARADALAQLDPNNQGPSALQIRLARQSKTEAMKAINSHKLTMQALIQAWQIVGQDNAVLQQAAASKGAIDTYHAVSSQAIVSGVQGLSHLQQMQLRERIAQAEAHRGLAPNQPGTQHTQHHVHVKVDVESKDSHIVKVTKRHRRQTHQRAGSRR
jgi:TP901 family phage tail tape measure protein